jgi:hypothetical protein
MASLNSRFCGAISFYLSPKIDISLTVGHKDTSKELLAFDESKFIDYV